MKRINTFLPFLHAVLVTRCGQAQSGFDATYRLNDADLLAMASLFNTSRSATLSYENARLFVHDVMSSTFATQKCLSCFAIRIFILFITFRLNIFTCNITKDLYYKSSDKEWNFVNNFFRCSSANDYMKTYLIFFYKYSLYLLTKSMQT